MLRQRNRTKTNKTTISYLYIKPYQLEKNVFMKVTRDCHFDLAELVM